MKVTGIVRKIDNLGRIVIPKELRSSLKIEEGDSVEIISKGNGEITLKKYDELGNSIDIIRNLAKGISNSLKCDCYITDREKVLATFPINNENITYNITAVLEIAEDRETFFTDKKIIVPIVMQGVLKGMIIVSSNDSKRKFTEKDVKALEITSKLIEDIVS